MRHIPALLQALVDRQIQFVIVGGFAVQLHGFVRSTIDMDLVLAMDDDNLDHFIEIAKRFELVPVAPVNIEALKQPALLDQWHQEKGMQAFALRHLGPSGDEVDVLVRPVVPFDELAKRAISTRLFGCEVKVASIEDLLTMKRQANRTRDRIDIEALEKIRRGEDPNV